MTADEPYVSDAVAAQQAHRNEIRSIEVAWVAGHLGEPSTVLELGAGNGRQAAALSARGHRVLGIDLPHGRYAGTEVLALAYYDGCRFPVRSESIDVIFSSHVLEHVVDLDEVLAEARRVLRPGGRGVHVMPTATWRGATIIARYGVMIVAAVSRLRRRGSAPMPDPGPTSSGGPGSTPTRSLRTVALPSTHGANGTAWTELHTFSERAWRRRLDAAGWKVERVRTSGLFYSGSHLFGAMLTIEQRRRLARILGSSSKLYEVRPR